jgi:hypothetical protein
MEKEELEQLPHERIEIDVTKIKKFGDQFTYRQITEIKSGINWYDFVNFPDGLVNCETKVFVSIAERRGTCATAEDAHFNIFNVAPTNRQISLIIYLGNTTGQKRTAQIDFLGFTLG